MKHERDASQETGRLPAAPILDDGPRIWPRVVLIVLLSIPGGGQPRGELATARLAFVAGRHRGMGYAHQVLPLSAGYGSHESARSLARLRDIGVNWISITPFGFQRDPQSPTFGWVGTNLTGIAETDESVRGAIRQARALGIDVMMKPHIWLSAPHWPGAIAPLAQDRASWFRTYEQFILHYALLSEEEGVGALCIGNELSKMTPHEFDWRRLITTVRRVYSGALTYAAETDEVFSVPFWDALDFIGVNAYWPLANAASPDRRTLVDAWRPLATRLRDLSTRHGRMVVFTELGYRSAPYGAWRHWEIPRTAPVDLRVQAEAYEAFFEAVWPQRWVGGVYWWKWFSSLDHSGTRSNDFELEGKPAEDVVAAHYLGRKLPPAIEGRPAEYNRSAMEYWLYFLKRNPVVSTFLGSSRRPADLAALDGTLRDWSPSALEDEGRAFHDIRNRLVNLDPSRLSARSQVDRSLIIRQIDFMTHQNQRRYWQRALDTYVNEARTGAVWHLQQMRPAGGSRFGTEAEWKLLAARVAEVPKYLRVARANLLTGLEAGNHPDWRMVEYDGLGKAEEDARYFAEVLPMIAAKATRGQPFSGVVSKEIAANGAAAAAAFRDFSSFLHSHFAVKPRKDRFAIGEGEYNWALGNNLGLPFKAAELYEQSLAPLESTRRRLRTIAREVAATRHLSLDWTDSEAATRAVLDSLNQELPSSSQEALRWHRESAGQLLDCARRNRLFEIPQEYRLNVALNPSALGPSVEGLMYQSASQSAAPRADPCWINPTWPGDQGPTARSRPSIAAVSAHQGFPGRSWYFTMACNASLISPARLLTPGEVEGSSSMWVTAVSVGGWALYAQRLMSEPGSRDSDGCYSPEQRVFQLQAQLFRELQVRVDTGLHTKRLTFDEGIDLYSRIVDFLPGSCAGVNLSEKKVASCRRAWSTVFLHSKWPLAAITHHLGLQEIVRLRQRAQLIDRRPESLGRFHTLLMEQGPIPVGSFEAQLLADMKGVGR